MTLSIDWPTASVNEASFSCVTVHMIPTQEQLHFSAMPIFCTWVRLQPLWTASNVRHCVYEVVRDYIGVTVSVICFHPHYVMTKSVNAAINCSAIWLQFII